MGLGLSFALENDGLVLSISINMLVSCHPTLKKMIYRIITVNI